MLGGRQVVNWKKLDPLCELCQFVRAARPELPLTKKHMPWYMCDSKNILYSVGDCLVCGANLGHLLCQYLKTLRRIILLPFGFCGRPSARPDPPVYVL